MKALLIALAALSLPTAWAGALSITVPSVDARFGLLWLGNAAPAAGGEGAPSPILSDIGVSVPLRLSPIFSVVPELDFFGWQYQIATSGTKAVPTEIESADSAWLLTVLLGVAAVREFRVNGALSVGVSAIPAFFFHIPTKTWGKGAEQVGAITGYFYKDARFFYPGLGAFLDWQVLPKIVLEVRLRSFFPIFHLWDGEGDPFYDQLMVEGSLGLRFSIGKQP